jgi:hypothetical protein
MSDPRKPTTKLGRQRRDPRTESVPPSRQTEEILLRARRKSDSGLPAVLPERGLRGAAPPARVETRRGPSLEEELDRERAERAAEADLMGQILARATQAEARVRVLEQSLARVNEERVLAESQLAAVRAELEEVLRANKASYDAQSHALGERAPDSRADHRAELRAARSLAAELLASLDAVLAGKTPSRDGVPSQRPRR